MEPKDGGPAYPVSTWNNDTESREVMGGMSLRDHFAGLAMQGHVVALGNMTVNAETQEEAKQKWASLIAELSYRTADAMLAERERGR